VLSIANSVGWSPKRIDIENAFLHGFLSEDVYMIQLPRFIHPSNPHHVCKLHKAQYDLKQAPVPSFLDLVKNYSILDSRAPRQIPCLFTATTLSHICQ